MNRVAEKHAMPTKRMKILTDELNELISKLETSFNSENETDHHGTNPTVQDWLETAMDAYNMRRSREKIFEGIQLFGEPTWDILLDLFIAELKGMRMQTTSVCIGAQVPQTTALRWIALLEREELVYKHKDRSDSRRVYIQLTELALRKMVQVFYDRCLILIRGKKHNTGPTGHDTGTCDDLRETILDDAVAQIRATNNP